MNFIVFGALGTFALLLLQWIISWKLPHYPWQVSENLRDVQKASAEGNYQGNGDIFNLDRSLMQAELDHPGSTLRIYYYQPAAMIGRFLGSLLVSFTLTGWVLGNIQFTCLSTVSMLFRTSFLLYPYLTWNVSKPRFKK